MIPNWSNVRVARITLELETPLSIGSGAFDPLYDLPLVLDANGLPTIPGTSLAGVLRHTFNIQSEIFGNQDISSRLEVSFAHIHDQNNQPVDGLILDQDRLRTDAILGPLLTMPTIRDRVRLNEQGRAVDRGKFDRCIVPGGYRFTFELCLWGESTGQDDKEWEKLRSLVHCLRLGGATHSGLGRVRVQLWQEGSFNLSKCEDFKRYCALPRRLNEKCDSLSDPKVTTPRTHEWAIDLEPTGGWRIGDGSFALGQGKEPDALPLTENWVMWQKDEQTGSEQGIRTMVLIIPGAGIKGALRHRTLFHYRCLKGWFAGDSQYDSIAEDQLEALFGCIGDAASGSSGATGKLFFDDIYLSLEDETCTIAKTAKTYPHNSIDRFTQGGRRGRLFSEEVLMAKPCLRLRINKHVDPIEVDRDILKSFFCALQDLAESNLSIGAGFSRGQGFLCAYKPDWTQCRNWLGIQETS